MKIIIVALVCLYAAINIVTANAMSAEEMADQYITGQCTIGKFAANIFYAPAWALKALRVAVRLVIK